MFNNIFKSYHIQCLTTNNNTSLRPEIGASPNSYVVRRGEHERQKKSNSCLHAFFDNWDGGMFFDNRNE